MAGAPVPACGRAPWRREREDRRTRAEAPAGRGGRRLRRSAARRARWTAQVACVARARRSQCEGVQRSRAVGAARRAPGRVPAQLPYPLRVQLGVGLSAPWVERRTPHYITVAALLVWL